MQRHIGHLLRRAYIRARKNSAAALANIGDLSPVQASAIAALMDGPLRQADLGRRIETEPANTYTLLQRMIKAGWVFSQADASDARFSVVALTAEGHVLSRKIESVLATSSRHTLSALNEVEARQLLLLLQKITQVD